MIHIGLISNVLSERNKRGMPAIDRVLSGIADVRHERLSDVTTIPRVLAGFAREGVGIVAVNSGDGTIQAVLTELLEARPFATPPPLAILSGGMTNMTAGDVGLPGPAAKSLHRLMDLARLGRIDNHLIHRRVLKLENVAGHPPLRGMFLGAAGIVQAIELCRARVHTLGLRAGLANAVTLTAILGGLLMGRHQERFPGEEIAVSVDGSPAQQGRRLLLFATTLDRLVFKSRPFWNTSAGPVRFTSVAHPPKDLARSALKVLYGGPDRRLPNDAYVSGAAHRLAFEMDGPFTLDGQMFRVEAGRSLVVTAPDQLSFIRC